MKKGREKEKVSEVARKKKTRSFLGTLKIELHFDAAISFLGIEMTLEQ